MKYRAPYATEWQELELETAMDMIAERVIAAREAGWQDVNDEGFRVDRTLGFAHLGGATLDNEENYLIKKAFHGPWARSRSRTRPAYDTSSTVPGLGTTFGRGGATDAPAARCRTRLHPHRGHIDGRGPPGRLPLGG